ncbi:MAG TPA: lipoyl(octanoyl) transferase LipB [Gammaproteobacteria bacterium]|nr:lipoyl(octanoyl) transferase LipB [Gammaproteobacteria bacterium]
MNGGLIVRELGRRDYESVWKEMQDFTKSRDESTVDELWFVEHPPVYTQGVSGKAEHVLDPHGIPVIQSNRGGQVTYHGPGQIVAYVLFDLRRKKMGVRDLVSQLENAVIDLLKSYGVAAAARKDAPGVYVEGAKVAALGLRVSQGCSYHGLALNVDMDLMPFQWINPCGYKELKVTQLRDLGIQDTIRQVKDKLLGVLTSNMGYTTRT